jgi:hypothetical protein
VHPEKKTNQLEQITQGVKYADVPKYYRHGYVCLVLTASYIPSEDFRAQVLSPNDTQEILDMRLTLVILGVK